jgi:signal transduction histidine kinase
MRYCGNVTDPEVRMEWMGWLIAAVAVGVAVWLWRRLVTERAAAYDLLVAKLGVENEVEALRESHTQTMDATRPGGPGTLLGDTAQHLFGTTSAMRDHLEKAGTQFVDYRDRVRRFDAAVQYCLQPVELIFGADKATLDQLIGHVEGARRKLFEARAVLERHPFSKGVSPFAGMLDDTRGLADYAQGLSSFGQVQAVGEVDVNACMDDALRMLVPRFGERIGISRHYEKVPSIQARGGDVRQLFVHVLDHAARTIAADGTLSASTRRAPGGMVEIAITETGSGSGDEMLTSDVDSLFATNEGASELELAQRLVENLGGAIAVRTTRGRGSTWTLTLPLEAPQAAAVAAAH